LADELKQQLCDDFEQQREYSMTAPEMSAAMIDCMKMVPLPKLMNIDL